MRVQIGVKLPVRSAGIHGKYQYSVASGILNQCGRVDQRIISMLMTVDTPRPLWCLFKGRFARTWTQTAARSHNYGYCNKHRITIERFGWTICAAFACQNSNFSMEPFGGLCYRLRFISNTFTNCSFIATTLKQKFRIVLKFVFQSLFYGTFKILNPLRSLSLDV